MADTCFAFNLEQLTNVGCHVSFEGNGLRTIAHIELPDGSTVSSATGGRNIILHPWHEGSQDAINRLVAIGAEPVEFEDIPF